MNLLVEKIKFRNHLNPIHSALLREVFSFDLHGDLGRMSSATLKEFYQDVAETLSCLPTDDPAFEHFYNQEKKMRTIMLYRHLVEIMDSGEEPQLALVVDSRHNHEKLIEIFDVYNLGYKPWFRYETHGVGRVPGYIMDLRGKSLEDEWIMEAIGFIRDLYNLNPQTRKTSAPQLATLELANAKCFF